MRAFAVASISIGLLLISCGPTGPQSDDIALSSDIPTQATVAIGGMAPACTSNRDAAGNPSNRLAFPVEDVGAAMRELAAGNPVLLVRNASSGALPWHCSVLFGYDSDRVYLQGPVGEHHAMPTGRLGRLWHDGGVSGLVMLAPGTITASARQDAYIRAVAKLTRNGMAWESVMAFDAALAVWPDSAESLVGLGDALAALGDLEGAAAAYRDAAAKARDPAPALAGLAEVLNEMRGRKGLDGAALAEASEKKTVGEQNR